MSVIGPRPGLWNQDILTAERDKYNANDVKPGLTGWAQINGRDELEIPVKAKLDRNLLHLEVAWNKESVCEKNNVQLFLTTHSLETIDVLLEDCRDTLDDIAFYHIRNSEEQSVTRRYSGKKLLDLRTEIGFDIR